MRCESVPVRVQCEPLDSRDRIALSSLAYGVKRIDRQRVPHGPGVNAYLVLTTGARLRSDEGRRGESFHHIELAQAYDHLLQSYFHKVYLKDLLFLKNEASLQIHSHNLHIYIHIMAL